MPNSTTTKFQHALRRFRFFGTAAVVCTYLVILAGGIVRSTGAGMGCPDWPKCFGQWVPPTDVSQLPADYRTKYDVYGHGVEPFNAAKTWTEYINRLVSVVLGFLLLSLLISGFIIRKQRPKLFWLSVALMILTLFQAWFGGKEVVASNLLPVKVTIHMLLALVIAFLLIFITFEERITTEARQLGNKLGNLKFLALVALLLTLVQTALGTQVRETIDIVAVQMGEAQRTSWIDNIGLWFYIHRSFSLLILAVNAWLYIQLRKNIPTNGMIFNGFRFAALGIGATILMGISLAYLGYPFWAQPLHLLFGSVIAGAQFVVFIGLFKPHNAHITSPLSAA